MTEMEFRTNQMIKVKALNVYNTHRYMYIRFAMLSGVGWNDNNDAVIGVRFITPTNECKGPWNFRTIFQIHTSAEIFFDNSWKMEEKPLFVRNTFIDSVNSCAVEPRRRRQRRGARNHQITSPGGPEFQTTALLRRIV